MLRHHTRISSERVPELSSEDENPAVTFMRVVLQPTVRNSLLSNPNPRAVTMWPVTLRFADYSFYVECGDCHTVTVRNRCALLPFTMGAWLLSLHSVLCRPLSIGRYDGYRELEEPTW